MIKYKVLILNDNEIDVLEFALYDIYDVRKTFEKDVKTAYGVNVENLILKLRELRSQKLKN